LEKSRLFTKMNQMINKPAGLKGYEVAMWM